MVLLFSVLLTLDLVAQEIFTRGCYRSKIEIMDGIPRETCYLEIKERSNFSMSAFDGNPYKLVATKDTKGRLKINKDIWAYSDGFKFYLNAELNGYDKHFVEVLDYGRYLPFYSKIFIGEQPLDTVRYSEVNPTSNTLKSRLFIHVLDRTSGVISLVHHNTFNQFAPSYPDLVKAFFQESDQTESTLLHYIKLMNDKVEAIRIITD